MCSSVNHIGSRLCNRRLRLRSGGANVSWHGSRRLRKGSLGVNEGVESFIAVAELMKACCMYCYQRFK